MRGQCLRIDVLRVGSNQRDKPVNIKEGLACQTCLLNYCEQSPDRPVQLLSCRSHSLHKELVNDHVGRCFESLAKFLCYVVDLHEAQKPLVELVATACRPAKGLYSKGRVFG